MTERALNLRVADLLEPGAPTDRGGTGVGAQHDAAVVEHLDVLAVETGVTYGQWLADVVILRTPDGNAKVELAKYRSPAYEGDAGPAPANAPGIRHILFVVDDVEASLAGLRAHGGELVGELVNYENSYWLCYVRGPAGIIVELAQTIG